VICNFVDVVRIDRASSFAQDGNPVISALRNKVDNLVQLQQDTHPVGVVAKVLLVRAVRCGEDFLVVKFA